MSVAATVVKAAARESNGIDSYVSSPGGGAGGKFRKKPYRRSHATTPYDRPPSSIRNLSGFLSSFGGGNDNANGGWLRRIVNPAQRIITASAHKLFASVFQKRITLPSPSRPLERVQEVREIHQESVNRPSREHGAAVNEVQKASSTHDPESIVDLEKILKQRTFSKSQIDRLAALLHARTLDSSVANEVEKPEVFSSGSHGLKEGSSSIVQKTDGSENLLPATHTVVLDGDVASPTELAKSYMGTRLSKVVPSGFREDSLLITSSQQTPKLPVKSLVPTSSYQRVVHENGYITPRSRGRSAIYSLAQTPYARVHKTTPLKILEPMSKRGDGRSVAHQELERVSGSHALKRRSSIFENDIGSVGPVRRIRHKPNLLYQKNNRLPSPTSSAGRLVRFPSTESNNKFTNQSFRNEGIVVPSRNMPSVTSKSTEIASKILEQLDKIVSPPEEKSCVDKLSSLRDRLPLKLSPSDLCGKDLKSLERIEALKLPEIASNGGNLVDSVVTSYKDSGAFALQDVDKIEHSGPSRTRFGFDQLPPASNRLEETTVNGNATLNHKLVNLEVANPLTVPSAPTSQTFKMNSHEDYIDLVDDDQQNESVSINLIDNGDNLGSTKKKPVLSAETDAKDEPVPVFQVHALKERKTMEGHSTANFGENTVSFSGIHPTKKNLEPNVHVASFKPVSESSSSFSISVGPGPSVAKATELNKVDEKKDSRSGVFEIPVPAPLTVTPPATTGLFKFGIPTGPASADQPSLSLAEELNAPPPKRPLSNLPLVASSAVDGRDGKPSLSQSASNFAVQAPIFKFGLTTVATSEIPAVSPVEAQTKASLNPFSVSSTSSASSIFGFSSPASNGASYDKLGSLSFGVSNESSQVQASTSGLGLPSSTQTVPLQFGSSAPSFSFGLAGNANATSGSYQFATSSDVKLSTGTSLGVTASTPLESTVPSSSISTATNCSSQTTAAPVFSTLGSSSSSPSTVFSFGATSSSANPIASGANVSSSSKSIFGSFGASTSSNDTSTFISNGSLPTTSAAPIFGSAASTSAAIAPTFMFGASAPSSPSQPVFGNSNPVFSFGQTSTEKNDQMNAEDIMAEDTSPAATPPASLFGQQPASLVPPSSNFALGPGANPFQFGGQQNFPTTTNPLPFAAPGGLDFNSSGGGSFSLGTGGGDKSGRKIIKVKHRQPRRK